MTDEAIILDTLKFIREQTTYISERFVNIRNTIWYNFSRSKQDLLENRLLENTLVSFNAQNQNEVELTAQSRLYIEKENNKLEIIFLKYLRKQPDIKLFMENNFIKPDPKSLLTNNKSDNGVNFLKDLKGRGLISYEDEDLNHVNNWYEEDPPINKRWFNSLHQPMKIKITALGKTYLSMADEMRAITNPDNIQSTLQIKTNNKGTWLTKVLNKIIDNIILTIVTIIGTVVGTILAIMLVNYFTGKGFKL